MNTLFLKHRWMQVVWGILLIVAGGITILFATINNGENVTLALTISVALVLFTYGLTILFASFIEIRQSFFKLELIIGTMIVASGIVFCLNKDLIPSVIVSLVSSCLLTFGAVLIVRGVIVCYVKMKTWWMPLCYIFGTLFIAGGIVALIFRDKCVTICYIVLGAILFIVGIIEVIAAVKGSIKIAKASMEVEKAQKEYAKAKKSREEKSTAIDAQVIDVSVEEDKESNDPKAIEAPKAE